MVLPSLVPGSCVRCLYSLPSDLVRYSISNDYQSLSQRFEISTLLFKLIVVIVEESVNWGAGNQGQHLPIRSMKSDTSEEWTLFKSEAKTSGALLITPIKERLYRALITAAMSTSSLETYSPTGCMLLISCGTRRPAQFLCLFSEHRKERGCDIGISSSIKVDVN